MLETVLETKVQRLESLSNMHSMLPGAVFQQFWPVVLSHLSNWSPSS